jgi:hypothetical protein
VLPSMLFSSRSKESAEPVLEQLDDFKCQRQVTTVSRKSIGG